MDKCDKCTARGDFDRCRMTKCSLREHWGFREAVEQAHMAGQTDAGCRHPGYSNARAYFDQMFCNTWRMTMKEYQFILPTWIDVHADSVDEAVKTLNASLHLLDEPFPAPGRIQRVQVDTRKPVTKADIVSVQDLYTGE